MKYLKLFENYDDLIFKTIDANERHKLVTDKGYQDFDSSDISYLKKEFWDDSIYYIEPPKISRVGTKPQTSRRFDMWCKLESFDEYEFKIYKIIDEYFIVDTWSLKYNGESRFLGHTLCDQIDGLVEYIKNQITQ